MSTDRSPEEILAFLRHLFDTAIAAAQADICLPPYLSYLPRGKKLIVVGAGKASAAMARSVEQHWQGELTGLVITRYGHAEPCERIEIVEAGHPVPDQNGLNATQRLFNLVRAATQNDTVLCLFSGGGSALLTSPLPGISLAEKQLLTHTLLDCGASITEINCIRRHLSSIKGGRLSVACHPAQMISLIISDVPGDDPADIASGPTVADATTCADALAILDRYGIEPPPTVRDTLASGVAESIKPGNPLLDNNMIHLIATPMRALEAAAQITREAGIPVYILGDSIQGESRELGKALAGIVQSIRRHGQPFKPPCILLTGGETTVTVKGKGIGGRNVEYLLSLAIHLQGEQKVYALAGDTDGIDGRAEIAGAVITPTTLERAWAAGFNPHSSLDNNDAHSLFSGLGDSVITGPTRTNVNDFRAIYIG